MHHNYLEFEKPVAELEKKIEELQRVSSSGELDLEKEILQLRKKSRNLTREIFSRLTPWQVTQLARHPDRPYTLDYVARMVDGFQELHGDRMYADDPAIVAGIGRIDGRSVALIGHQKGRDTRERTRRNFGMPRPEGYRKARRVMQLAERFGLPVVTLIDTPGAYPGVGAEERGQSEAIARSLELMAGLGIPIVSVVIGEGGSGGALAIGVCDYLLMLEYATYSVISPEGCASILWKSAENAAEAAQAMGVTSRDLEKLGLVDRLLEEPLGGAHNDPDEMIRRVKEGIVEALAGLDGFDREALLERRYERLMSFGQFQVKD